ncbi:exopeptidase [Aureococcus anophagefferens]|nr:exopeptidase [Aureococcus anophagefferens]
MRLPLLLPGALAALLPLERVLIDTPEPQLLRSHMYNLTQFDHLMASPGDHANARYVRDELRRLGFDAEIQEVPVMTHLPAGPPTLSAVEGGAVVYEAKLAEDVLAADPTSDNWYRNMTFNAYAPSGDVAARVVYANFGMPATSTREARAPTQGKIALTRYGGCFRGLKAMNAEARGAGVQRGSAQYLSLCAGDPFRLYLDADAPDPCGNAARALAAARDAGWRPRRTVVLCSWSGEEYGLLGSTAYAELEARGALEHATAYVNVDVAVGGNATLEAAGTQSLDGLFAAAAADAHVVRGGAAVALDELWVAAGDSEDGKAAIDGVGRRPRAVFYPRRPTRSYHVGVSKLGTLGSGSDYTAFVDHLGIPSLDFSFQGPAGTYGTYHSVYDSYACVDAVIDPDWEHHAAAARLLALLVFRLADARVLPVAPTTEARAVAAHAPGYYLGYGATSFPGPVHAVEDGRLAEADAQVREAADRVDAAAAYLREICG